MLLKALLVVEEALKVALCQSSEIFPISSQCHSLGTQIVTSFVSHLILITRMYSAFSRSFMENADLSLILIPTKLFHDFLQ